MGGCVSPVIYLIVSDCYSGPKTSSQLNHLKLKISKASLHFIQCIFSVPHRQGWVSLVIYPMVSGCYISPKASSQIHHLKLRASKASLQFIQCIFWVLPRQGYIQGVVLVLLSILQSLAVIQVLKLHPNMTILNSEHPKPHKNSYSIYFGSQPDRVEYRGLCESCYLFYSLCMLYRS